MPPFWAFLCQRWLGLSYEVAWCWWGALGKSRWSQATALRAAVVAVGQHPFPGQRPDTEKTALGAQIEGKQLVELCADLQGECSGYM